MDPLEEFMRIQHSFIVEGRLVSVDLAPFAFGPENEAGVWISRTIVPAPIRGRGYGSRARRQLCEHADRLGITLYSVPAPYGGLTLNQLVAWYGRYGFERYKGDLWRRTPTTPQGGNRT